MKVRLIQAGTGGMGKAWWSGAIKDHPNVEVVALVDINDAPLRDAGEALGVPAERRYKDLAQAVDAVKADAVLTVTPPPIHVKHAEIAFSHGLHLLTEKPIGATLADGKRMVALAKEAGKQLMVAQNYRYGRSMSTLARLVREQPLGPLGHGHIDFYIPGDFRGSFRQTMEQPLLIDMAIHHFDLIRAITGRNITKVTAHTFKPQWSWFDHHPGLKMLMELEGGMPFSYSGDWTGRGRCTGWSGAWRLQCEHGSLEVLHDESIRSTRNEFWQKDQVSETIPADESPETGQRALLSRFVQSVRTNTPAETNGEDNLWSFAAVSAAHLSAQQGRAVDVAELM
ncbi:MAG TPA: Gfo/Idh/MocA family oxidoreductase [Tepidisphaeraceae bacterium]|jgi:predicted dehydrogenase